MCDESASINGTTNQRRNELTAVGFSSRGACPLPGSLTFWQGRPIRHLARVRSRCDENGERTSADLLLAVGAHEQDTKAVILQVWFRARRHIRNPSNAQSDFHGCCSRYSWSLAVQKKRPPARLTQIERMRLSVAIWLLRRVIRAVLRCIPVSHRDGSPLEVMQPS